MYIQTPMNPKILNEGTKDVTFICMNILVYVLDAQVVHMCIIHTNIGTPQVYDTYIHTYIHAYIHTYVRITAARTQYMA